MALEAGFDWIDFLHQRGSAVDAWTIDINQPGHIDLAHDLVEHGIDALTTDTPVRLANLLTVETVV
jgi:glycerophosphoryl diester phosphodiesterase